MAGERETPARKFSSIVFLVILVVFVFSVVVLINAIYVYQSGEAEPWEIYVLIGVVGLALSSYMLLQTRRRLRRFTLETQPVNTTEVCEKCGFKSVREFERGDFILKKAGKCPKCEGDKMISAIYREIPEKKKEDKLFA